jgi:branched-chain amino acid transport system permease protein
MIMRMGYLSFGHAAYAGIGAYTSAILSTAMGVPPALSVVIAGVVSAVIGYIIGTFTLKLRGVYFSITVFAFAEVMRTIWLAFDKPFGGPQGIANIPKLSLLGYRISSHLSFYYLILSVSALLIVFLYRLDRSHFGFTCLGLQTGDSELLAKSVGINTNYYKNLSFAFSCMICGITGGLYSHYMNFISPFVFTIFFSNDLIVYNMVGGTGSILGPIIGAGSLTVASELLIAAGYYRTVVFGILLIIVIVAIPGGIVSLSKGVRNYRWNWITYLKSKIY